VKIAGLYPGVNIWKVDRDAAAEKISQLPRVETVTIELQLPDTLLISIQEKETMGLIPYQGNYIQVAADGSVIGTEADATPELPLISGVQSFNLATQRIEDRLEKETLSKVLRAIISQEQVAIKQIDISQERLFVLTGEGVSVNMGQALELEKKLESLAQILPYVNSHFDTSKGFIDIRVPDRPVFKFAEEGYPPKKIDL